MSNDPPAPPSTTTSAARRVHDNDDLRREIASFMSCGELARKCVVISSLWMETAAEIIYKEVGLATARSLLRKMEPGVQAGRRDLYRSFVRHIRAHAKPKVIRQLLRVMNRFPGASRIAGAEVQVDLVRRVITLKEDCMVDFENGEIMDPPFDDRWPPDYAINWEIKCEVDDADQAPSDFLELLKQSCAALSTTPADLTTSDNASPRVETCRITGLMLELNSGVRPRWWKDIFTMPHLESLQLRGVAAGRLQARDIVRIAKSNGHRLQSLSIDPGWTGEGSISLPDWLSSLPSLAQLPQVISAMAANTHLNNVLLNVRMNLQAAKEFAMRCYRDAIASRELATHRLRKRDLFVSVRVYSDLTNTDADERTAFRHLIIGENQLVHVNYPASVDVAFHFPCEQQTEIYDYLQTEFIMDEERGALPDL